MPASPRPAASLYDTLSRLHPELAGPERPPRDGRETPSAPKRSVFLVLLAWFGLLDLVLIGGVSLLGPPGDLPEAEVRTAEVVASVPLRGDDSSWFPAVAAHPTIGRSDEPRESVVEASPPSHAGDAGASDPSTPDSPAPRSAPTAAPPPAPPPEPSAATASIESRRPIPGPSPTPATTSPAPAAEGASSTVASAVATVPAPASASGPTGGESSIRRARRLPSPPLAIPPGSLDDVDGTVVLRLHIGTDGRVRQARVLRSLAPEIDGLVLAAARTWRYEPALGVDGPRPEQRNVALSFRSQNAS